MTSDHTVEALVAGNQVLEPEETSQRYQTGLHLEDAVDAKVLMNFIEETAGHVILLSGAEGTTVFNNWFGPNTTTEEPNVDDGAYNDWSVPAEDGSPDAANVLGGTCVGGNYYDDPSGLVSTTEVAPTPPAACTDAFEDPAGIPGTAGSVDLYPLAPAP